MIAPRFPHEGKGSEVYLPLPGVETQAWFRQKCELRAVAAAADMCMSTSPFFTSCC